MHCTALGARGSISAAGICQSNTVERRLIADTRRTRERRHFDVSHMGTFESAAAGAWRSAGRGAAHQHERCVETGIGQAHYSAMLYPEGTFVDDVIVHRLGEDDFLLVINAGTREKDINWVRENTKSFDCVVEDLSDVYTNWRFRDAAVDLLRKLTDVALNGIKNYWFTHGRSAV